MNGRCERIQTFVRMGANINLLFKQACDIDKSTKLLGFQPLHLAVWLGHNDIVKELINNGANPRGVAFYGYTPIDLAAMKGRREIIEVIGKACIGHDGVGKHMDALIRLGSKMVYDERYYTLLKHLCLEKEFDVELFHFLLNIGGQVEAKDVIGYTPLHLAVLCGHEFAAKNLIENGVDVDSICTSFRLAPLHFAVCKGDNDIVELLLANGADLSARTSSKYATIDFAAPLGNDIIIETLIRHSLLRNSAFPKSHMSLSVADSSALTRELLELWQHTPYWPLTCTAAKDNKPAVIELVKLLGGFIGEEEADSDHSDTVNDEGSPYYLYSIRSHQQLFPYETLFSSLFADTLAKDDYPLITAVRYGSVEALEVLLQYGLDTSIEVTIEGHNHSQVLSFIHFAIYSGHLGVLQALVSTKEELIKQKDDILYYASFEGKIDVIQWVMSQGLELTTGNSLLHTAASTGQLGMVEFLIKQGLPFDEKDNNYSDLTPLLLVVEEIDPTGIGNHIKTAELLLEHGADAEATSPSGATPLLAAVERRSLDMVIMLLGKGTNVRAKKNNGQGIWHLACSEVMKVLMEKVEVKDVRELDEQDVNGDTPMKLAIYHESIETMIMLLKAGVKAGKSDKLSELLETLELLLESKSSRPMYRRPKSRISSVMEIMQKYMPSADEEDGEGNYYTE